MKKFKHQLNDKLLSVTVSFYFIKIVFSLNNIFIVHFMLHTILFILVYIIMSQMLDVQYDKHTIMLNNLI